MYHSSNNKFYWSITVGGIWGPHTISPLAYTQINKWYFVCGTNDNVTAKLYIDGELVKSEASGAITAGTKNIWLRRNTNSGVYQLDGKVEAITIYNRALSAAEINWVMSRRSVASQ